MSLEAIIAIGFIALIAVETTISWLHNLRTYEFRDTVANFALAFGDLFMAAAMKAVFLVLFGVLHRLAPLDMGLSWMSWALLVVINDLIYYVFHRLGHRCRFMWRFTLPITRRRSTTSPLRCGSTCSFFPCTSCSCCRWPCSASGRRRSW